MIKSRNYLFILITFIVYSLSTLFSKFASIQDNNFNFLIYYGLSLFVMFLYAVLWQYVLKLIPLNIAFSLKSITLIFSVFFGFYFFHEVITFNMILSCFLIVLGIILVVK